MEEAGWTRSNVGFKLAAVASVLVTALATVLICCAVQNSLNRRQIEKLENDIGRLKQCLGRLEQDAQDKWQEVHADHSEPSQEDDRLEKDFMMSGFLTKFDSIEPSLMEEEQDKVKHVRYKRSRKTSTNGKKKTRKIKHKKDRKRARKERKLGIPAIHLYGSLSRSCSGNALKHSTSRECPDLNGKQIGDHGFLPKNETLAFWRQAKWAETKDVFTFNEEEGSVTIHEDGMYFIYAQIYYTQNNNALIYQIMVAGETVFACKTSSGTSRVAVGCSTSGLARIRQGQKVIIWNKYIYPIVAEESVTFWGVIKLS